MEESFIDIAYDDVDEQEAAPEGDYDLRCVKAEAGTAESGRATVKCAFVIEGVPDEDYQLASHTITFPTAEDKEEDKEKWKMMVRSIKRFGAVFDLDVNELKTPEDWAQECSGVTGNCMVVQSIYKGNIYSNLRLPRIE